MQQLRDIEEREQVLTESIKELECVNKKLAHLIVRKEALTDLIIAAFDHEKEGQRAYEFGTYKVECKTPFIYSLNKKLYESGEFPLPDNFNPIKSSTSYSIDKRLCDEYLQTSPRWVRDALVELIDKKPGKPSVSIRERI